VRHGHKDVSEVCPQIVGQMLAQRAAAHWLGDAVLVLRVPGARETHAAWHVHSALLLVSFLVHGLVRERRYQQTHPANAKTELVASIHTANGDSHRRYAV
jgi:hypothetical protein